MCKTDAHQFLKELPKCEHHLHIEGSLSPRLLFRLAGYNNIALPDVSVDPSFASPETLEARYERFTSLNDFLHYYYIGMSVLITSNDFEELAYEYFIRAHNEGVRHAEIFFDPQAHTSRGIVYHTVVEGLNRAQKRAKKDVGLTSELIMCFLRHLPVQDAEDAYHTAERAGHLSNGTITGIGLDSSEVGYPPEIFREVYTTASAIGLRRTAHAGEEGDDSYISRALDLCNVERIDHGIRLIDNESLLRRVASEKILLTVCPLSNVRLRCVKQVADLPIRQFLDKGIRFSINSDDPAYFGGYILDNYFAVQEAFGLSLDEWRYISEGAIQGSWCNEGRKTELMTLVAEWAEKYREST